ncbi:tRNA (guanine-N(7)-)-methyltransferase non-catalytic subunit wdr4-like isoform X1 [Schistocerca gregaria]|uniref:tRNA (guanine-N(7)-)-methyltransferase non-catalytic subunit wdr4-like isoform X1 n=1 Tax=Schistocerca gregaria TaxID=7010 RepID=UPI00211E5C9C|nr:tRNA (guanine-N(7)-)-methyltransferase non-catalytic subunit wdr4-like isoform X1 [Schistocerca gregaria]
MNDDELLKGKRVGYALSCNKINTTDRATWVPSDTDQVALFAVDYSLYLIAFGPFARSSSSVAIVKLRFKDYVRTCSIDGSGRLLAVAFQSKKFSIFDLNCPCSTDEGAGFACCYESKLSKKLVKIQWENESSILCADKFGTFFLYCFQIDATGTPVHLSLRWDKPRVPLGHYSTVTEFLIASPASNSDADRHSVLVSADKDEKIRVSRWPHAYDILCFCLGHTQFVSSLCIVRNERDGLDILLSAGGDSRLIAWDYTCGRQLAAADLSDIVDHFEGLSCELRRRYSQTGVVATNILYLKEKNLVVIGIELLDYLLFYGVVKNGEISLKHLKSCRINLIPTKIAVDAQSKLWIAGLAVHSSPILVYDVSICPDGLPSLDIDKESTSLVEAFDGPLCAETVLDFLLQEKNFRKQAYFVSHSNQAPSTEEDPCKKRPHLEA